MGLVEVVNPDSRMGEAQASGHVIRTGHKLETVRTLNEAGEYRHYRTCC